jgi:phosphate transport system permease protein
LKISARTSHKIAWGLCWAAAAIVLSALAVIIVYIFVNGIGVIDWEFLSTSPIGGMRGEGGILSAIVGTIYLVALTVAIATPLGLLAGLYLAEYARDNWLTNLVRYGVETLAGVPSIVFGLFGFAFFVIFMGFRFSILSGALTMACLVLPTIIRTSEEAIKAVPWSHREASYALGTTKWQTIRQVVLPAAMPGIITAVILAIGRSIEETACLFLTMGGSSNMPTSVMHSGRTLALHLYYLVMETLAFEKALGTGVVLVVLVIVVNWLTRWLSGRYMKRLRGR